MSMGGGGGSQEATAEETALAERSATEFNDYQERFVPFENEYIEKISGLDSEGRKEELAGMANADATQAFAGVDKATVSKGLATGAGVGSGKTVMNMGDNSIAHADAMGEGMGMSAHTINDNKTKGLLKIAKHGRGLADTSMLGLSSGAKQAQALSATKAKVAAEAADYNLDTAMGIAGYGAKAYNLRDKKTGDWGWKKALGRGK